MSHLELLVALVLAPILFGAAVLFCKTWSQRKPIIVAATLVIPFAGILLAFSGRHEYHLFPQSVAIASALEILVAAFFIRIGLRLKHLVVTLLAVLQFGLILYEKFYPIRKIIEAPLFIVDSLSTILVLVVSIIGSLIVLYAIGYMEKHEHHAPPTAASAGRFFFLLIAFLGFMNGLVLANQITWFSLFWELTTLCSFMLISHDGTPLAKKNAARAILLNLIGGLALTLAAIAAKSKGAESLTAIMAARAMTPMALLALAAFAKSAQMPFQSWLLGAMVAPTPVSALLHSSTMVKAGSYLILRLSPAFMGTRLAAVLAVAGAFTFAATSALAIGQSNGKKVLAYSTIANLGLIVACAGIGTPIAYAAGVMILCFHALSKSLLFLCMGNIEQAIGTREIEDMIGLMPKMPVTTIIAVIGMISMFVPPFSMLISKWIAIEAAVDAPVVLILIVIGSALTILFWAKWIGRIATSSYGNWERETFPRSVIVSMGALVTGVVIAGFFVFPVFNRVIVPIVVNVFPAIRYQPVEWMMLQHVGGFMEWPLFFILGVTLAAVLLTFRRVDETQIRPPFLCGENMADQDVPYVFRTIKETPQKARLMSYYFTQVFGEEIMSKWANPVAFAIILLMFGVIWKP